MWNKINGNLAFLRLGDYISQDTFEITGYLTNRNKNERMYFSKRFATKDFNAFSFENIPGEDNKFRIISSLDSLEKDSLPELLIENLYAYKTANGNLISYQGMYSQNGIAFEFMAQTDPIPILVILAGVAIAATTTTYFLVSGSDDDNDIIIVEDLQAYQECRAGGGAAKLELASSRLFSRDEYRFVACVGD